MLQDGSPQDLIINFKTVTSDIVDLYITIFKQLHHQGKKAINAHVVEPLRKNYERANHGELNDFIATLNFNRKSRAWKRSGNIYRKLLQQLSWDSQNQALMKIISQILLDLQKEILFRESNFAKEFVDIFRDSFYEFEKETFSKISNAFEDVLDTQKQDIKAPSSTTLSASQKNMLNKEAESLYQKIERSLVMQDKAKFSYFLAQFTGRFCNFPDVVRRKEVDAILEDMANSQSELRQEIKNRLSIRLYNQIISAVNTNNLRQAVRGISTYALTFQGETNIPYRKELDVLEEKLYAYISKHNLWSSLTPKG